MFIDKARSEEGVLAFVRRYGPLTYEGLRGSGDVVEDIIDQANEMASGRVYARPLSKLNVSIVTDDGVRRLKVSPACLLDALWLQFAQANPKSRRCLNPGCGRPFLFGAAVGKRSDAQFCSDECRVRYHSLKRSR